MVCLNNQFEFHCYGNYTVWVWKHTCDDYKFNIVSFTRFVLDFRRALGFDRTLGKEGIELKFYDEMFRRNKNVTLLKCFVYFNQ